MRERRLISAASDAAAPVSAPILLESGAFLPPMTLTGCQPNHGEGGSPGVEAQIYYDGTTLFARSLGPERAVRVNQVALAGTWTPIACPARIELGERSVVYDVEAAGTSEVRHNHHWQAQTVVVPMVARVPPVAPELPVRGKTAIWCTPNAVTAVHTGVIPPRIELVSLRGRPDRPAPRRSEPSMVIQVDAEPPSSPRAHPRAVESTVVHESSSVPRVSRAAAFAGASTFHRALAYLEREFRRTSRAIRWTLLALPAIAWWTLTSTPPTPQVEARASIAATALPTPIARGAEPAAPEAAAPEAAAPEPATLAPAAQEPAAQVRMDDPRGPSASRLRKTGGSRTSLEASAADAAARGASAEAEALYLQLAELHPDRPEFASAARILRRR